MFLNKQNDNDRYYEFASYAYKDDDRTWYHRVDGTSKDFPPFTNEQIRREKWNYTKKVLLELNICTEILLDKHCPLKTAIWYMAENLDPRPFIKLTQ